MKGKKIIITGGGRGIGAHIARALAGKGCSLALLARTEGEVKKVAAELLGEHGVLAFPYVCDVSRWQQVADTVQRAVDQLGGVDALINNAAVPGPLAPLEDADLDAWRGAVEVNLLGTAYCCRAVLPTMKGQGRGKIVNLSGAGVGWKGFQPYKSAYIASKFAVYGFTEALAREVEGDNIQVNALSPGPANTRLRSALVPSAAEREAKDKDATPDADPAARMAAFLVSDRSDGLTGKIISANWDDPDELAFGIDDLNRTCRNTLRKIDGVNYRPFR